MIILASQSRNRQEIFTIAKIKVKTMPADVDEKSVEETDFSKRALAIARLKASAVVDTIRRSQDHSLRNAVIISGDGFNICKGKILEKPKDLTEAKTMLKFLSGNKTTFFSALVMHNLKTREEFSKVVSTVFWFRKLSESEIDDYLQSVNVLQYSAAYSPLNTKAISFGRKISGSLTGFSHSMPMDLVVPKLIEWGEIKQ